MPPDVDGTDGGAPIDRVVLEYLRDRLGRTRQVGTAAVSEDGRLELRVRFDDAYYPAFVTTAALTVRWYANDDFSFHYREIHEDRSDDDGAWECRWDRHPNPYDDREHLHPPPDAVTPGEAATWPDDYRDVTQHVLSEIESRSAELWGT